VQSYLYNTSLELLFIYHPPCQSTFQQQRGFHHSAEGSFDLQPGLLQCDRGFKGIRVVSISHDSPECDRLALIFGVRDGKTKNKNQIFGVRIVQISWAN